MTGKENSRGEDLEIHGVMGQIGAWLYLLIK
jgi:hypothetical protein